MFLNKLNNADAIPRVALIMRQYPYHALTFKKLMAAPTISLLFCSICAATVSSRACTVSSPMSSEKLNSADAIARRVALTMRGRAAERPELSIVTNACIPEETRQEIG